MIDRKTGDDADLIIEDRWPQRYDEDKLFASATHHRDVVSAALDNEAQSNLQTGHTEATTRNAGALAQASADKTRAHLRDNDASTARHLAIAEQLENLGRTVVSGKNRINAAVDTFVAAWEQAPELAKANNWYQHDYNQYRTQLVDQGRATVTEALHDIDACNDNCVTTLRTALEA